MRKRWLVLIGCLIALVVGLGIGYVIYQNFPPLTEEKETKENNTTEQDDTETVVVDSEDSLCEDCLYHIQLFTTYLDRDYGMYDIKINNNYVVSVSKLKEYANMEDISSDQYEVVMMLNSDEAELLESFLSNVEYTHDLGGNVTLTNVFSYSISNYNLNKALVNTDEGVDSELNTLVLALAQGDESYFDYYFDDTLNQIKNYSEIDINSSYIQELYDLVTIGWDDNGVSENYLKEKITNSYMINVALLSGRVEYEEITVTRYWNYEYETTIKVYSNSSLDSVIKSIFGENAQYNIMGYEYFVYDEIDSYENGGCNGYEYSEEYGAIVSEIPNGCAVDLTTINELIYAYETDDKLVLIERSLFLGSYGLYRQYDGTIIDVLYPDGYNIYGRQELVYDTEVNSIILNNHANYVTYYSYTFIKNSDGTYYYTSFDRLN